MQQFFDVVQSRTGAAVAGATVTVYNSAGGAATLYSDNGVTIKANPTTTNADGEYSFYAANGTYSLTIGSSGFTTETRTGIQLYDPADGTAVQIGYNEGATGAVTRTVQAKLQESISVKDFGAKGDGVTDDYNAFKAAIAVINANGGGTLYLPYGTYFINQYIISGGANQNAITDFVFSNCDGLVIEGEGSTIQLKGGWTMTKDFFASGFWYSYSRSINMFFYACNNVTVNNLYLNGGAATITKAVGLTAENISSGVGLEGCNQVTLNNLKISYYCTDGLVVDAAFGTGTLPNPITTNLVVNNGIFTNNARQGCSILQLRYAIFSQCVFSNTGNTGLFGRWSPQAGVDVEPNYTPVSGGSLAVSDYTGNITFEGCLFKDNGGNQYVATNDVTTPYPIQLTDCTFFVSSSSFTPRITPASKHTNINNCYFNNVGVQPQFGVSIPELLSIEYCTFINSNSNFSGNNSLLISNVAGQFVSVKNNRFYFTGTAPHTDYGLYIQSPQVVFTDNYIYTSAALHNGATFDFIHLLQFVNRSENNTWDTNLITASKLFSIDFSAAVTVNDYFVDPAHISPINAAWFSNYFSLGKTPFNTLIFGAGAAATIGYGSAIPTTGTYVAGSIVYNTAPTSGGYVGWVCTVAGTPGTWKTFGLIS